MDVRIERTKRALQDALIELARERPFHELTIGQITDRAEVNRSSFYQHYSTKETLLADALDAASSTVGAHVPELTDRVPRDVPPDMVDYMAHIESHADLYRLALSEGESSVAAQRIRQRFEQAVDEGLDAYDTTPYDGLPRDIVCAGVAGAALAIIERWLVRDPRPSAEVASEWVWHVLLLPKLTS